VHRLDQRLVAVPEVDGAPEGSLLDPLVRPAAVLEHEGQERAVLLERHLLGVGRLRGHGGSFRRFAANKKPPAGRAGGGRRAPVSGRPPYVRRSPEVARSDSIPLIVRHNGRSVKCGPVIVVPDGARRPGPTPRRDSTGRPWCGCSSGWPAYGRSCSTAWP